jgi:hypothetical protein
MKTKPDMPRAMKRALADVCRFGTLKQFPPVPPLKAPLYAANAVHYPEAAHEQAAVDALVNESYATRHGAGAETIIAPTAKGQAENDMIREASRQ